MFINMQIIADHLKDYPIQVYLPEPDECTLDLTGVRLAPACGTTVADEYVYITTLDAIHNNEVSQIKHLIVVVPEDSSSELPDIGPADQSIIIMKKAMEPLLLLEVITGIFEFFNIQMTKLLQAVAQEEALGKCLNIACHLFGSPIIFLDNALTVVASTHESEGGLDLIEEIWPTIVRYGHVSMNSIKYYESTKEPEHYFRNRKSFFHTINPDLYHSIRVNIFVDNTRVGRLLIPDDYTPLTNGHLALADYIAPLFSNIFRKQEKTQNLHQSELEQFVCKQLDGFTYSDEAIIAKYLARLDWNAHGNYYLVKVVDSGIAKDDIENQSMRNDVFTYTMRQAKSVFDNCIFALYRGAAFYIINTKTEKHLSQVCIDHLIALGNMHALKIGISMRFDNFSAFKDHYSLVSQIIDIGKRLSPERKVYFYDDYASFNLLHAFAQSANNIAVECLCCAEVNFLYQHDQKNNTNLLNSLFMYVITERSLMKAAEKLHIHRNTLVYRLEKIGDLIEMDLENPIFRLRVISSCLALYYCNANVPSEYLEKKR